MIKRHQVEWWCTVTELSRKVTHVSYCARPTVEYCRPAKIWACTNYCNKLTLLNRKHFHLKMNKLARGPTRGPPIYAQSKLGWILVKSGGFDRIFTIWIQQIRKSAFEFIPEWFPSIFIVVYITVLYFSLLDSTVSKCMWLNYSDQKTTKSIPVPHNTSELWAQHNYPVPVSRSRG